MKRPRSDAGGSMEEGRGAPVDNDVFTGFNFFEVELANKPSTAQPWAAWELMSALYRTAGGGL